MQLVNITTKRNEDFCLTLRINQGDEPFYIAGAMFYMDIKNKDSGSMKIATLSNDNTYSRQGFVYVVDASKAKIKLFLGKEYLQEKKFVNTWKYDLIMRQYNTYFNIMRGSFTVQDAVTDVGI